MSTIQKLSSNYFLSPDENKLNDFSDPADKSTHNCDPSNRTQGGDPGKGSKSSLLQVLFHAELDFARSASPIEFPLLGHNINALCFNRLHRDPNSLLFFQIPFSLFYVCSKMRMRTCYLSCAYYKKAFDKVRHGELFNLLQAIQVEDKNLRILRSVYVHQSVAVRFPKGLTNWVEIKRGVRQGCIVSPDLFNLHGESILRSLDGVPVGVSINGVIINNIRYADDIVSIATTEEGLQQLLDESNSNGESKGFSINHKKKEDQVPGHLEI